MTADVAVVQDWIYDQLSADATITGTVGTRIYANAAPQGTAFPLVTFAFIGGADRLHTVGGKRVTWALYLVRAVAKGNSLGPIEGVAGRFDAALNPGAMGTLQAGINICACTHDQPHVRSDGEDAVPMVYLGAYYRVYFHPVV